MSSGPSPKPTLVPRTRRARSIARSASDLRLVAARAITSWIQRCSRSGSASTAAPNRSSTVAARPTRRWRSTDRSSAPSRSSRRRSTVPASQVSEPSPSNAEPDQRPSASSRSASARSGAATATARASSTSCPKTTASIAVSRRLQAVAAGHRDEGVVEADLREPPRRRDTAIRRRLPGVSPDHSRSASSWALTNPPSAATSDARSRRVVSLPTDTRSPPWRRCTRTQNADLPVVHGADPTPAVRRRGRVSEAQTAGWGARPPWPHPPVRIRPRFGWRGEPYETEVTAVSHLWPAVPFGPTGTGGSGARAHDGTGQRSASRHRHPHGRPGTARSASVFRC